MSTTTEARPLEWGELWDAMKREPQAWQPTTAAMYDEMLDCLPPRAMAGGCFLVGEPETHNANGEPVYACFRRLGGRHDARYMTFREFNAGAFRVDRK